jgi:arabinose 5-phosphate isomerase
MSNFLLEAGRQTLMLELQEASRLPERLGDDFIRAAETIIHCEGKLVVSGIGKSGHIGKKLAATFASTGTPAFFVHPAEALHGDLGMLDGRDVMLFISYSGSAKELDLIVPRLEEKGIPLLAMTGKSQSRWRWRQKRYWISPSNAKPARCIWPHLQHRQHPDARRRAGDGGDAGPRFQ